MPSKDLYICLKNGRTVHVTDQWDGVAPTEEGMVDSSGVAVDTTGKEVSDPYRDIYTAAGSLIYPASQGSVTVAAAAAVVPSGALSFSGGNWNANPAVQPGVGAAAVTWESSDEVSHRKPRQYFKVFTWLIFNGTDNTKYKWRKASVEGWGDQAPIDL